MTKRSPTILLVDDDEAIVWTLTSALSKCNPALKIYQAHSGLEAFGYIKQLKHLDLLITDIHMPQLSGLELMEKLQNHAVNPEIIVITGFGSPEIHRQAESLGAVRYFTKPFDIHDLAKTAIELIEQRKKRDSHPGFVGNFGNLKMVDIIQINCLIQQTGLLLVKSGSNEGKIYFSSGAIVHAETSQVMGQDAVYEIISWGSGNFEFRDEVKPVSRSIQKSWEFLLMESARRNERHQT